MKLTILAAAIAIIGLGACTEVEIEQEAEYLNTVSVGGKGFVMVTPDQADVRMSITLQRADLKEAQAEVATIANRFLELADKLDIDKKDIQTTGANVRPEYRWNKNRNQQELIGYRVDRQLLVQLKDLDKLGALLESSVKAGINQVSPPVLKSSRERDAYREALALAAKDARANAETLATALDARLGDVVQINSQQVQPGPRPMMRMEAAMADSGGPEASYNAGDIRLNATVSASFALK